MLVNFPSFLFDIPIQPCIHDLFFSRVVDSDDEKGSDAEDDDTNKG